MGNYFFVDKKKIDYWQFIHYIQLVDMLFRSFVSPLIFCLLVLLILERGVLKSPSIIVNLSVIFFQLYQFLFPVF